MTRAARLGGAPLDAHCHLDFMADAARVAADAAEAGAEIFACTVTPAGFARAAAALAPFGNVLVGAGAHPWWAEAVGGDARSLVRVREAVAQARFVGEVGLDFGSRCAASPDAQRAVFRAVAEECARGGGRVVSVHAVRAAGEALDVLERAGCLERSTVVFHWFSGTSDDLARAVRAGCLFSVGERMLASRRGRACARQIPSDRLLLETDAPRDAPAPPADEGAAPTAFADLRASLERALRALESLRGKPLEACIAENSRRVSEACGA